MLMTEGLAIGASCVIGRCGGDRRVRGRPTAERGVAAAIDGDREPRPWKFCSRVDPAVGPTGAQHGGA